MRSVFLVLLIALVSVSFVESQSVKSLFGKRTRGELTFYGAGADSGGTCMLNNPKHDLGLPTIAVGSWGSAAKCGMCVKIYPLGTGSGNSNFPKRQPFVAYVNNMCPECGPNNLDLAESSDGRWDIEWEAVSCPVQGNIQLQLKTGSSKWHTEISARNFKVPLASMQFNTGSWETLTRRDYNFFILSKPVQLPAKVRLISINNDVQEVTLTEADYGRLEPALISTNAQFGGASSPTNPTTPPTTPTTPQGPTPSSSCSGIAHAHDPSSLYWVEVWAPTNLKVQLQCATGAPITCKFVYNIKFQCAPTGACPHPRKVILSNGKTCALPQTAYRAGAVSDDLTFAQEDANNDGQDGTNEDLSSAEAEYTNDGGDDNDNNYALADANEDTTADTTASASSFSPLAVGMVVCLAVAVVGFLVNTVLFLRKTRKAVKRTEKA